MSAQPIGSLGVAEGVGHRLGHGDDERREHEALEVRRARTASRRPRSRRRFTTEPHELAAGDQITGRGPSTLLVPALVRGPGRRRRTTCAAGSTNQHWSPSRRPSLPLNVRARSVTRSIFSGEMAASTTVQSPGSPKSTVGVVVRGLLVGRRTEQATTRRRQAASSVRWRFMRPPGEGEEDAGVGEPGRGGLGVEGPSRARRGRRASGSSSAIRSAARDRRRRRHGGGAAVGVASRSSASRLVLHDRRRTSPGSSGCDRDRRPSRSMSSTGSPPKRERPVSQASNSGQLELVAGERLRRAATTRSSRARRGRGAASPSAVVGGGRAGAAAPLGDARPVGLGAARVGQRRAVRARRTSSLAATGTDVAVERGAGRRRASAISGHGSRVTQASISSAPAMVVGRVLDRGRSTSSASHAASQLGDAGDDELVVGRPSSSPCSLVVAVVVEGAADDDGQRRSAGPPPPPPAPASSSLQRSAAPVRFQSCMPVDGRRPRPPLGGRLRGRRLLRRAGGPPAPAGRRRAAHERHRPARPARRRRRWSAATCSRARPRASAPAGGLAGGVGVLLLYRGLATGTMSIVAPITAVLAGGRAGRRRPGRRRAAVGRRPRRHPARPRRRRPARPGARDDAGARA